MYSLLRVSLYDNLSQQIMNFKVGLSRLSSFQDNLRSQNCLLNFKHFWWRFRKHFGFINRFIFCHTYFQTHGVDLKKFLFLKILLNIWNIFHTNLTMYCVSSVQQKQKSIKLFNWSLIVLFHVREHILLQCRTNNSIEVHKYLKFEKFHTFLMTQYTYCVRTLYILVLSRVDE